MPSAYHKERIDRRGLYDELVLLPAIPMFKSLPSLKHAPSRRYYRRRHTDDPYPSDRRRRATRTLHAGGNRSNDGDLLESCVPSRRASPQSRFEAYIEPRQSAVKPNPKRLPSPLSDLESHSSQPGESMPEPPSSSDDDGVVGVSSGGSDSGFSPLDSDDAWWNDQVPVGPSGESGAADNDYVRHPRGEAYGYGHRKDCEVYYKMMGERYSSRVDVGEDYGACPASPLRGDEPPII